MTLTQITKIRGAGIHTTSNIVSHNINSSGIITAVAFKGPFTGSSNIQSGIVTATKIDLNGDIDVDGHTNLDNVSIAGVTTTAGLLNINAGGRANTFKVEDLTDNRVVIAGSGGELESSTILTDNGSTLAVTGGITATTGTFSGNVNAVDGAFSGNVSIGGTLTYEDVTNIDSVGIITARDGLKVLAGGANVVGVITSTGANITGQTTIAHTASPQLIIKDSDTSGAGDSNGISLQDSGGTEYGFIGQTSTGGHSLHIKTVNTVNPIRLQVNSTTRLEVGNTGCFVTGVLDVASGGTSSLRGDVYIPDKLRHISDDDTAIRFPANDTISFETAGDERLRIDLRGNMGLGANSIDNAASGNDTVFAIKGKGSSYAGRIEFQDSSGNKDGGIHVDSGILDLHSDPDDATTNSMIRMHVDNDEKLRITSGGDVLIGDNTAAQTNGTNLITLDLGGTYHDTAGSTGKLKLYNNNTDEISLGVSNNQFDFIVTQTSFSYNVYGGNSGTTRLAQLNQTGNNQLLLGSSSSSSQAAPLTVDLGGTYSSADGNGNNLSAKLKLWCDGTNLMGLSVSDSQLEYIVTEPSYDHVFYGGSAGTTQLARITGDGSVNIGGDWTQTTYKLKVTGSFAATTKSFVIDHPTKENHQLRYACLEGPENSVYVRGRSSDSVIELPDYWVGLVHDDSITVNVTPIGNKKVWVESINNNSVTIGSDDSAEYFYTIFAERKDVEKLEVEVEK